MKYVGNVQSQANSEVYATASGALPNGKPVVVNSNGTVSVIAGIAAGVGSAVTFNNANTFDTSSVFDSNSNKVIVAYRDVGQSQHGYAVVGTVSGTSISFGTPVEFENAVIASVGIGFDSNLNKVLIVYKDEGNSNYGTSIVGTVSGTNISFGTPVVYSSANTSSQTATFDSNSNKMVVAYKEGAKVGTISGTGISYGSAATFSPSGSNASFIAMCFDSNSNKLVVSFRPQSDNHGYTAIGTVSGTSISFGTAVKFNYAVTSAINNTFDSNSNKVVVAYDNDGNSSYGTARVGTVSGTSISFGSPVVFKTAESNVSQNGAFNTETNTVVLAFASSGTLAIIEGTVSGTSISFGSEVTATGVSAGNPVTVFDSNAKKTVASTVASPGKSVVFSGASTNLTTENFVGITNGVVDEGTSSQALGSAAVFESANANNIGSAYDSTSNKVVVAYRDDGDSAKGKAVVGTVDTSDNSISFGTPVQFEAGDTENISAVFDANSGKIVISFKDNGNSGYGKAVVGTVSGTSISFGSAVNFIAANSYNHFSVYDSTNNKVVIMYTTLSSPYDGKAVVGTVSGTTISFGSAASFSGSNQAGIIFSSFDSTLGKVVVAYQQSENSGYAAVGTVSGTNISFGSPVNFNGGTNNATRISCAYDSTANRTVIFYRDQSNSSYDTAIVGTVSGTTISFGTKTVVTSQVNNWRAIAHDANAGTNLLAVSSNYNFKVGTVDASDNSMTFSGATTFEGASANFVSALFDSTGKKVVLSYQDSGNSNYGTSTVVSLAAPIIIRGSTASGSTAIIQAGGAVNTLQTGLTAGQQYFVQTDGTLGLTAGSLSVIAGTAVSATDLIVKG